MSLVISLNGQLVLLVIIITLYLLFGNTTCEGVDEKSDLNTFSPCIFDGTCWPLPIDLPYDTILSDIASKKSANDSDEELTIAQRVSLTTSNLELASGVDLKDKLFLVEDFTSTDAAISLNNVTIIASRIFIANGRFIKGCYFVAEYITLSSVQINDTFLVSKRSSVNVVTMFDSVSVSDALSIRRLFVSDISPSVTGSIFVANHVDMAMVCTLIEKNVFITENGSINGFRKSLNVTFRKNRIVATLLLLEHCENITENIYFLVENLTTDVKLPNSFGASLDVYRESKKSKKRFFVYHNVSTSLLTRNEASNISQMLETRSRSRVVHIEAFEFSQQADSSWDARKFWQAIPARLFFDLHTAKSHVTKPEGNFNFTSPASFDFKVQLRLNKSILTKTQKLLNLNSPGKASGGRVLKLLPANHALQHKALGTLKKSKTRVLLAKTVKIVCVVDCPLSNSIWIANSLTIYIHAAVHHLFITNLTIIANNVSVQAIVGFSLIKSVVIADYLRIETRNAQLFLNSLIEGSFFSVDDMFIEGKFDVYDKQSYLLPTFRLINNFVVAQRLGLLGEWYEVEEVVLFAQELSAVMQQWAIFNSTLVVEKVTLDKPDKVANWYYRTVSDNFLLARTAKIFLSDETSVNNVVIADSVIIDCPADVRLNFVVADQKFSFSDNLCTKRNESSLFAPWTNSLASPMFESFLTSLALRLLKAHGNAQHFRIGSTSSNFTVALDQAAIEIFKVPQNMKRLIAAYLSSCEATSKLRKSRHNFLTFKTATETVDATATSFSVKFGTTMQRIAQELFVKNYTNFQSSCEFYAESAATQKNQSHLVKVKSQPASMKPKKYTRNLNVTAQPKVVAASSTTVLQVSYAAESRSSAGKAQVTVLESTSFGQATQPTEIMIEDYYSDVGEESIISSLAPPIEDNADDDGGFEEGNDTTRQNQNIVNFLIYAGQLVVILTIFALVTVISVLYGPQLRRRIIKKIYRAKVVPAPDPIQKVNSEIDNNG